MILSLASIWLVIALSGCILSQVEAFTNDRILLPLTVSIWLAGDPGEWTNDVPDISKLTTELKSILPIFSSNRSSESFVHFDMKYDIKELPNKSIFISSYRKLISASPIEKSSNTHQLSVSDVSEMITELVFDQSISFSSAIFSIPIVIVKGSDLPKHVILSYTGKNGAVSTTCSQSVLSSVAFFDLSAKACDLHSSVIHFEDATLRWSSFLSSDANPFVYPISRRNPWVGTTSNSKNSAESTINNNKQQILSRLCGIVTSAVQSLAVGDLQSPRLGFTSEKIFIPIMVLKSSTTTSKAAIHELSPIEILKEQERQANEMEAVANAIDVPLIKAWAEALLHPTQQVEIVTSIQFVEEHPALATSLASATAAYSASISLSPSAAATTISVPFIDSRKLLRELKQFESDALFKNLLSSSGHGQDISALSALEAVEYAASSVGSNSGSSSGSTSKERLKRVMSWFEGTLQQQQLQKRLAILPVVVLTDMDRYLNASGSSSSASVNEPIQPLFDRISSVAVVDNTVLAMCASARNSISNSNSNSNSNADSNRLSTSSPAAASLVRTFSPMSNDWRKLDLSNINAQISSGISQALTGLRAPHLRSSTSASSTFGGRERIDITWTHGIHPFGSYGTFDSAALETLSVSPAASSSSSSSSSSAMLRSSEWVSVFIRQSHRTILVYRLQKLFEVASKIDRTVNRITNEIVESVVILDGTKADNRNSNKQQTTTAPKQSSEGKIDDITATQEEDTDLNSTTIAELIHPLGMFMASDSKYSDVLSTELVNILVKAVGENIEINNQLVQLVSFANANDIIHLIELLSQLEIHANTFEIELENWENVVYDKLSECVVLFKEDVRVTQRKAVSGLVYISSVADAVRYMSRELFQNYFVVIVVFIGIVTVIVLFGIRFLMSYLDERAKKLR